MKTWSTPPEELVARAIPCVLCAGRSFSPHLDCGDFAFVRCTRCGLVQRNPQPMVAETTAVYRERHGEEYFAYERNNEAAFLVLQQLALRDVGFDPFKKPGRVVDVGCATGALLSWFQDAGWDATGIELCGPSARYAREERGLDVKDVPLEEAALPAASFDLVHASHLIEHLNDPRSFLRESRRLLKKGGTLLVATPNIDGFQARLFGSRWRSAIFDHLYLFSVRTLRALMRTEGFCPVRIATWGGLGKGTAPPFIKAAADRLVKPLRLGDVMMIRAVAG